MENRKKTKDFSESIFGKYIFDHVSNRRQTKVELRFYPQISFKLITHTGRSRTCQPTPIFLFLFNTAVNERFRNDPLIQNNYFLISH